MSALNNPRDVVVVVRCRGELVARYTRRIRGRFSIASDRITRAAWRRYPLADFVGVHDDQEADLVCPIFALAPSRARPCAGPFFFAILGPRPIVAGQKGELKMPKYIDVTPTWSQILPALLALLETGTAEGRRTARDELERMAALADRLVELEGVQS